MQTEDFVHYKLFPGQEPNLDLVELRSKCLTLVRDFKQNYMWHQDSFVLNVKDKYLDGKVFIGDNVEDEWFIVSLLFYLR